MKPTRKAGNTRNRILQYISKRIKSGVPPTVREVQEEFGFKSSGTAREHIDNLVRGGFLLRLSGISRGLRLPQHIHSFKSTLSIPVLGRVQAGAFSLAVEECEEYISMESNADSDSYFALRVRGESMRDAGILENDIIVVKRQPDAPSGSIVVAMVENEATVKRLVKSDTGIELHPANPDFSVIYPNQKDIRILGIITELRRSF